jgi:hypothetical protein
MVAKGIMPYPMVYDKNNKELKKFQRWVIRRYYQFVPWKEYQKQIKDMSFNQDLFEGAIYGA